MPLVYVFVFVFLHASRGRAFSCACCWTEASPHSASFSDMCLGFAQHSLVKIGVARMQSRRRDKSTVSETHVDLRYGRGL